MNDLKLRLIHLMTPLLLLFLLADVNGAEGLPQTQPSSARDVSSASTDLKTTKYKLEVIVEQDAKIESILGYSALSNDGFVVGTCRYASRYDAGFVWKGGKTTILDTITSVISSEAIGVSEGGNVCGQQTINGGTVKPTAWINGKPCILFFKDSNNLLGSAFAINSKGFVATGGGVGLVKDGKVVAYGKYPPKVYGDRSAINEKNRLALTAGSNNEDLASARAYCVDFKVVGDGITYLSQQLPTLGGAYAEARAIDSSGIYIAGDSLTILKMPVIQRACLWTEQKGKWSVSVVGPDTDDIGVVTKATAVNKAGMVGVIMTGVKGEKARGYLCQGKQTRELGEISPVGFENVFKLSINDAGQVLVRGVRKGQRHEGLYLLTPENDKKESK